MLYRLEFQHGDGQWKTVGGPDSKYDGFEDLTELVLYIQESGCVADSQQLRIVKYPESSEVEVLE